MQEASLSTEHIIHTAMAGEHEICEHSLSPQSQPARRVTLQDEGQARENSISPQRRKADVERSGSKMSMHSQNTMNTINSRRSNGSRRCIKIDLNNFDEHRRQPPFLTSPRSLEACRKQGILPEELIHKAPSFFGQDKSLPPRLVELRYQTFNKARMERLKIVRETYTEMCKQTHEDRPANDSSHRSPVEDEEAKLIQAVMKQMEFQKKKQKEEVELILLLEIRAQRMKERAEAKDAEKARRAAELAAAKASKDAEWQEQKSAMEAKKRLEEVCPA